MKEEMLSFLQKVLEENEMTEQLMEMIKASEKQEKII
jgi:hypothetical protein